MAREFRGKIPRVPIDADTSKADQKIERLFQKIKNVEHIKIDADVSQAQRRLETLVKRNNSQMSSTLINNALKDFKMVLGAMKTEFENNGMTSIFGNLERTCDMVESRFANLNVSIGSKQFSGLEKILNNFSGLEAITDFSFNSIVSSQDVQNSEEVLNNIKAAKKEIKTIGNQVDYVIRTLNKNTNTSLSEDKLQKYKDKIEKLQETLSGFSEIDDPVLQNSLFNAIAKTDEAMSQINSSLAKMKDNAIEAQKEIAESARGALNVTENSKTIKSIDDLENRYFSIIGTVEKYLQLVKKLNKVSGNSSRGLRKQVIDFANEMPQDVASMLGEKFVQQLANGFKGISTKDIIKAIITPSNANAFGALQHQLDLAKSIDFNNIKYADDGSIKLSDSDNPFEFLKIIEGQLPIVNELYEVLDNIATAKKELGTSGKIEVIKQETEATEQLTGTVKETSKAREREADATEKATAAKTKYYEIDEKAAKLSKQMRSFDDYKAGSATASYRSAVDEIAKIVEEKKAQFPDQSDKLDKLFDRYAKNFATFINRDNQIGAQYPSVMISGAGNYNTKKHNKQMASWGKNYQYYDEKVLPIESRIRNFGSTGTIAIRNDESDALEKLEAKLEYMKYWHEIMVEVNKYYRKNKTLEGFEGVEADELERIKKDLATMKQVGMYDIPYPPYALSNDNQNIKRIEGRITELKRLKDNEGLKEENDIYKLWTDKQDMRIRISFEMGKPEQEIIDMLKGKSFKWSPKNNAWQRQLTDNAVRDTKRLQEVLHEFYGITSVPDTQSNIPAMEKLQSFIADLANKYGKSSFSNIFGETVAQFGELNASNAIELYDALIAKEKEYIAQCEREAEVRRKAAPELAKFAQEQNQVLNNLINYTEDSAKEINKIVADFYNKIQNESMSATEAIEGFTLAIQEYGKAAGILKNNDNIISESTTESASTNESKIKLFKKPKNNQEKLFNTLATGENAFKSKSKGDISGFNLADRETIAEALVQGLQQGLNEINIVVNNGKTTLTLAGGVKYAAEILNSLGFQAIESEITKFVQHAFNKKDIKGYFANSENGHYISDNHQMYRISRPLNEMESKIFSTFTENQRSLLDALNGGKYATATLPNNVREVSIDIPGGKKGGEKHYIFKTEDGQYLVVRKSYLDNIRKVSSVIKYIPNQTKNGRNISPLYGFDKNNNVVAATTPVRTKESPEKLFNSALPTSKRFSVINDKPLNIAGTDVIIEQKKQIQAFSEATKQAQQQADAEERVAQAAENAESENAKLTSSYKGLADAVERYVEASKKLWAAYDKGEDFSKFAEERNAAIEDIVSLFPTDDILGSFATLSQSGYRMLLQSKEMSSQFAKDGTESTLKAVETNLNQAAEEVRLAEEKKRIEQERLAEEAKAKQIAAEMAESKRKQAEAGKQATEQTNAQAEAESQLAPAIESNTQKKQKQAEVASEIAKQIEQQADAENAVGKAAEKANKSKNDKLKGNKRKKKDTGDENDIEGEIARIVQKDTNTALKLLRDAQNSKSPVIDLSGVYDVGQLEKEFSKAAQNAATKDGYEVVAARIRDNVAMVKIYNNALETAITQEYRMQDALDGTSAELQHVGDAYQFNIKKLTDKSKEFDKDFEQRFAQAQINNLIASLKGHEYSGKANLESLAGNIVDEESLKKFNAELKIAKVDVATLSKQISHEMNTFESMSKKMDNASERIAHLRNEIKSFSGIEGIGKLKKHIGEMWSASDDYKSTKDLNEQAKAYERYKKAEQAYNADIVLVQDRKKEVEAIAQLDSKMKNANIDLQTMLTNLNRLGNISGADKLLDTLNQMEAAVNEFNKVTTLEGKKSAFDKYNAGLDEFTSKMKNLKAIQGEQADTQKEINAIAQLDLKMRNASTEIDTMRLKLDGLGNVNGITKAKTMLDAMTAAVKEYNAAQDKQSQEKAYNAYNNLKSSFDAQLKYINEAKKQQAEIDKAWKDKFQNNYQYTGGKTADDQTILNSMSDFYKQQEEKANQFNNNIKSIYDRLVATVKEINSLDTKMNSLTFQDKGSGLYGKTISSLQSRKSELVADLRSLTDEINNALSLNPASAESGLSQFFKDERVQAALTSEEIQKFNNLLRESDEIKFNFGAKFTAQIQPIIEKIASLKKMIADGFIDKNSDITKNVLSIDTTLSSKLKNFTENPTAFGAVNIMKYVKDISTYIETLDRASQAEAKYFSSKTKYTQDTTINNMAQQATESAKQIEAVQKKLEVAARSFAKESGLGDAFITKFARGADGISKLDFSVFDTATNSLRNFRMEMGSVSDGMYITETTVNKTLSSIQAVDKQMQSMSNLIVKLGQSGVDINIGTATGKVLELLQLLEDLKRVTKGDITDQNIIQTLLDKSKLTTSEVEKLYNQMLKMDGAINNKSVSNFGKVDLKADVYTQATNAIKEFASTFPNTTLQIGRFNEATGKLPFTITNASGAMKSFEVEISSANGQMVLQEKGVKQLGSAWSQLKSSVSSIGRQFLTALVGYNVFFKVISTIKEGINYVKEIDLAMTELKKVTDESEASYNNFLQTASKTAGTIGSTVSDFTDATANFARLGYSMDESAEMAKTAIVYKNVADGLDTVEESTNSIISTMKAFGIESSDTMGIIDRFNEVGNNFAITSAGIGEALQRSASALYEGGNTIDESIGLVTAANSVIQNPEQVGTALKTLALRLRGTKTE